MGNICSKQEEDNHICDDQDTGLTQKELIKLEEDMKLLPDEPMFKRVGEPATPVRQLITADRIKSEYMRAIFEGGDNQEISETLRALRRHRSWNYGYEHDVLIAFWLAVDRGNMYLANQMMDFDLPMRQIATLCLKGIKEPAPKGKKKRQTTDDQQASTQNDTPTPQVSKEIPLDQPSGPTAQGEQMEGGRYLATGSCINDIDFQVEGGADSGEDDSDLGEDDESSYEGEGEHSSGSDSSEVLGWNSKPPVEESHRGEVDSNEDEDEGMDANQEEDDAATGEGPEPGCPEFHLAQEGMERYLQKCGITTADLELARITTQRQLERIRVSLQLHCPLLMANIVRVLLFLGEEPLACYLSTFYKCHFELDMIYSAIERSHYEWLNYLWVFDKNYIMVDTFNQELNQKVLAPERVRFEDLFRYIGDVAERQKTQDIEPLDQKAEIAKVCAWLIDFGDSVIDQDSEDDEEDGDAEEAELSKASEGSEGSGRANRGPPVDNILGALLKYRLDGLCRDNMGYYHMFLNKSLFIDAVKNNNVEFISDSLELGAFEKNVFKSPKVVETILTELQRGSKCFSLINTLLLTDINAWSIDDLADLISLIGEFVDEPFATNRLAQCASPLMIIALSAELLEKIGQSRQQFREKCSEIKEELLVLGKHIACGIDEEDYFRELLYDFDFQNRILLKIITSQGLAQLLSSEDPKAQVVMSKLYVGRDGTRCDGNIYGYSTFMWILAQKPQASDDQSFLSMITIKFAPNLRDDYTMQHRYARKSIAGYFNKDLFFSGIFAIMIVWQYQDFLARFRKSALPDPTAKTYKETVRLQTVTWLEANKLQQYLISGAYLFQLVQRQVFNLLPKDTEGAKKINPIEFDLYVVSDAVFAGFSLFTFVFIQLFGEQWAQREDTLQYMNYMAVIAMLLGLLKFALMFLVIEKFSVLMISLKEMLMSTNSILVIMLIYMLLYSQVAVTFYADFGGIYKDVTIGIQASFDSYLAAYGWNEYDTNKPELQLYKYAYNLLYILQLFIANILLLNFMIAILSDQYEVMNELGSFKFKCMLYEYCERYIIAEAVPEYAELVLHSPPFNLLVIFLTPFLLSPASKEFKIDISDKFSKLIFWIENTQVILTFFLFELMLSPIIFVVTYYNIVMSTPGFFTLIGYLLQWTFFGVFYLIYIVLDDVRGLIKILYMHHGCKAEKGEEVAEEEEPDWEGLSEIYNQVRGIAWELYKKARETTYNAEPEDEQLEGDLKYHDRKVNRDFDALEALEEHQEIDEKNNVEVDYTVRYTIIQDKWGIEKAQEQQKEQDQKKRADAGDKGEEEGAAAGEDGDNKEAEAKQENSLVNTLNKSNTDATSPTKAGKPEDKTKMQVLKEDLIGARGLKKLDVSNIFKDKKDPQKAASKYLDDQENYKRLVIEMVERMGPNEEDKNHEEEGQADEEAEEEEDNEQKLAELKRKELDEQCEEMLKKFAIYSESSPFLDTIDLRLLLMAMPSFVSPTKVKRTAMFNFAILQDSLTEYFNQDEGKAFRFYDSKNVNRIAKIRERIMDQKFNLEAVERLLISIRREVKKKEDIKKRFALIWEQAEQRKDERLREERRKLEQLQKVEQPHKRKDSIKKGAKKNWNRLGKR